MQPTPIVPCEAFMRAKASKRAAAGLMWLPRDEFATLLAEMAAATEANGGAPTGGFRAAAPCLLTAKLERMLAPLPDLTPDDDSSETGEANGEPSSVGGQKRGGRKAKQRAADVRGVEPKWIRALLVDRLGFHLREFAFVVLADHFRLPFSKLHEALLAMRAPERLATYDPARTGRRLAVAAPRGAAKSTIVSLLFPLHDMLYGQERYVVMISATGRQARSRLGQLRAAFEGYPWIARLFPHYAGRSSRGFRTSNVETLKLAGPPNAACRVDAFGAGSELRGLSDGAYRPTRIILDDVESNDIALNETKRAKLKEWYNEVLEPLGDRSTHIDIVGTMLHTESLLAELLQRPEYESLRFASILAWSERDDLWEEWRAICRSGGESNDPDEFLAANRDEMLAGTEVLWPEREPYEELMEQLTRMGRRAFLKEKQNEPTAPEGAQFDLERIVWFDVAEAGTSQVEGASGIRVDPALLTVVAFLDPATGRAGARGDDAAIAVIGSRAGEDVRWLLDVWMAPVVPTRQIAQAWWLHDRWGIATLGFEANLFQGLLADPIERSRADRKSAGLPWAMAVRPIHNRINKEERIGALQPMLETGRLRLRRGLSQRFLAQLEQWPHCAHDDGLDAVAAAVAFADQLMPATLNEVRTFRRSRGTF